MTYEQFIELYAMNLFSQEQNQKAQAGETNRAVWGELTKKQRHAYRDEAEKLAKEAGIE